MPNTEQLEAVAMMCNGYHPYQLSLDISYSFHVSCETCVHWEGICVIDKLDRILYGVEQR